MKKVITYGTFDLLHQGHINLLKRAKALGDHLIVGITSESYDKERGKLNVQDSLIERIEAVKSTGLADEIIVEEFEGQKILDIQKLDVDIFAIGSDWTGKFDYLNDYCDVIYLERTKGISSTELRDAKHSLIRMGIIGSGRIAKRFVPEAHLVSGVEVVGVFNPNIESAKRFQEEAGIEFSTDNIDELLANVDAVYIASPHETHFGYTMKSLNAGVHVLCEKPFALSVDEVHKAYTLAKTKQLALLHGIKTAYCPAFEHLEILAKSGRIGKIVDVDASFTKLVVQETRELQDKNYGGSVLELAAYPLFAITRFLGTNPTSEQFHSIWSDSQLDIFTRGSICFEDASSSFKVGLGAKTEGSMVVTGTNGYIYVPAPWWKTEYFEMRFENLNETRKFFYPYEGDGLRYEILEFVKMVHEGRSESSRLTETETCFIISTISKFLDYKMAITS